MAVEAYPTGSESGFDEESAISSERDRLIAGMLDRMTNFIAQPFSEGHFDIDHSATSLEITIDPAGNGLATLGGHLVVNDAPITLVLDANETSEIWLRVDNEPTGNAEVLASTTGEPAGKYTTKLWEVTTDADGVTNTVDTRQYVAFPNIEPDESVTGLKETRQGTPEPPTVSTGSSGVQSVDVTFDNPYRNQNFGVVVTIRDLDDTGVNFGWIRATNITVDGFTIEAKIQNQASGEAAFNWQAQGI